MKGAAALCVVDTNVAVAADGRAGTTPSCIRACAAAIHELTSRGHLVLDDGWRIISEYRNNLAVSGQPGPGRAFLKWVLTNYRNPQRCTCVRITPRAADPFDFEEFPEHPVLGAFDRSDRKFVAVAAAHPKRPPILQGTDSKWWGWKQALAECGVKVDFLCPEEVTEKYRQKVRKA